MVGCSTCGRELTYIAQYDRYYCYSCRAYAPKDIKPCPQCNRALVYVPQYQRYYCYGCQEYKYVAPVAAQPAQASNPCPTCGRELSFIQQYNRYYCYNCKAYAPLKRDTPAGIPAAAAGAAVGMSPPPKAATPPMSVAAPATSPPLSSAMPTMSQAPQGQATPRVEAKVAATGKAVAFSRQDLDGASKDQLMRWCQDYGLDASGMKYELRLRIMEYMRSHGLDFREGEGPSTAAEVRSGPSAAQAVQPEATEIVIEAISEGEEEETEEPPAAAPPPAQPLQVFQAAPQPTPASGPSTAGPPTPKSEVAAQVQIASPGVQAPPRVAAASQPNATPRPETAQRMTCPTCGGPLSYIAQYDRHYCYRCRAYAPRQTPLPGTAASAYTVVGPAQASPGYAMVQNTGYPPGAYVPQWSQASAPTQRSPSEMGLRPSGGNVMTGVYIMLLGLALYGVYEFLVNFPPDLNFGSAVIPPSVGFALRFLGLFFIVVGAMLGLILIYQRIEAKV